LYAIIGFYCIFLPVAKRSVLSGYRQRFCSNLAVTISNLLIGIMLSRILGAAGFGLYSSIIVVPIIVIGFTQFGIRRSTIYHIGNKILPEENIISALFLLLLWTSALSIIICGSHFSFTEHKISIPLSSGLSC